MGMVQMRKSGKLLLLITCISSVAGLAVEHDREVQQDIISQASVQSVPSVDFPAAFFALYQPNTALDMVQQLPGFQLDNGSSARGFAGAAGNILINGRRPSAKQDSPTDILARIPASQVERIELIRGQTRGINMQGHSVLANLTLFGYAERIVRWDAFLRHTNTGPLKPGLTASMSSQWREFDYMLGINIEREANGEFGSDKVYDANGVLRETRFDDNVQTGLRLLGIYLNTSATVGETLLKFNSRVGLLNGPDNTVSVRIPETGSNRQDILFKNSQNVPSFELGFDAERSLAADLTGKGILLYTYRDRGFRSLQRNLNADDQQTLLRVADSETISKEGIARAELEWSAFANHLIQFNVEGAYNSVGGSLIQTVDTGSGPVIVDVPDGNTKVDELRGDALLKDSWSFGQLKLDYGMGAEVSTISQSNEELDDRTFFFLKPQAALTYVPVSGHQFRLRIEREVSQLNFNDFISATVYEDDNLALGNPNLHPDATWISELGYERRFSRVGVFKITGFHHWIDDVLDYLPLTPIDAVPGNIGDGRRWGIEIETSMPVDWIGLTGSKLDIRGRWQDSSVIDPVNGQSRPLSANGGFGGPPTIRFRNGNKYMFDVNFRQDIEKSRIAWGWKAAVQAKRPLFKVNELDVYNEGVEVNAFVETTRWAGLKIRIDGTNLLNFTETRDRTIYAGGREISAIDSVIARERKPGRRLTLSLSGNF